MEEAETIKQYLKDLISVMANRAEKEVDILMPGYTHVQVRAGIRKRPLDQASLNFTSYSELNPSDGPISCSRMRTVSWPTWTD
jgi:hypothetical protein